MGILRDLRNTKQIEAARTVIKFHGEIAQSIITDAVNLAHDVPETAGTREAILFLLKRVAPSTASSIRNFTIWVNQEVASQMQEPLEAAPAEGVEFTNVRNIMRKSTHPRKQDLH